MKWFATCLLLGLVLGSSAFVKRDVGSALFQSGKEYIYEYSATVSAGSHDYVGFASVFNISANLHLQQNGNAINVRLDDIQFGAYNGEFSFWPVPVYSLKPYPELAPLAKPFQVLVENGKVKGVVLDSQVPEWAHNIKRGIASSLQLDLANVKVDKTNSFTTEEDTIVGDCPTHYVVIPGADAQHAQVRKFRRHSTCSNAPRQVRQPGIGTQYCPDENSRDLLNSTSYAVYDLEVAGGNLVVKRLTYGSTIVFHPLGVDGHTQFSNSWVTLQLKNENAGGSVAAPSNGQNYEHVHFVFDTVVREDEDLTKPTPFFFHIKDVALDASTQTKAAEQLKANIHKMAESLENVNVYKDLKDFHKVSPFSIIPLVSNLDYDHLTECLNHYKAGDVTEYKLFLDSLVVAGTGPAALVVRDIVAGTQETAIVGRLIAPLANYVRHPTQKLLKELEGLMKTDNTKHNERIIEFAFASLLNRVCKDGCKESGLLDKYVQLWSSKIDSATHFEEKTAAILALRNIALPKSAEKLLAIALDKSQDKSVRVAALAGVKPLLKVNPKIMVEKVMPIFYDRFEDSELRNNAALWTLLTSANENENTINEIVIYMWKEKDPQVKNYIKTLISGLAGSTRPCISKTASYAKTALQMFPKWEVQGKYSGNYVSDYYDRQYNFGHLTHLSVQKSGKTVLPNSMYMGLNGQVAGYGTNYLGLFVRLEGLGKSISSRIMSMTTGVIDFEAIQEVLKKIGVQERTPEPLRIELCLFLHGRVVAYHAADAKSVTTVPQLIKKIGELKSASYDKEMTRMLMIGGALVEQPLGFGTPVSTLVAVTGFGGISAKVASEKAGTVISRNYAVRVQFNLHAIATLNNHMTPFRSMHSVTAYRSLRVRVPRHITIGVDAKQLSLNFVTSAPTEEDPAVAMVHATAVTTVQSDRPVRHLDAQVVADLLAPSCPACKAVAVISKGDKYRETRQLGSGYKYKFMEGISAGAKYYDCEKIHSRIHVIRSLRKFFGPENKNVAGRFGGPLTQIRLGMSYAIKSIFLSPPTETCGLKAYFKQDTKAQSVFEKLEGQVKVKYESDPKEKIGTKVQVKSSLNFKYGGATPKTKSLDLGVVLQKAGMEKTELKVKLAARDESAGRNGVVCMDLVSQTNKVGDFFAYEGENEPTYERTININWGKEDKSGKEGSCPTGGAGIKIVKKARRSHEQAEEAKSDRWPYKQCRAQKGSAHYPGPLTPATGDCIWAAYKQTNLREANVTISYTVDPEARKRWRYPGAIIAGLLMPYWVPAESVDADAAHHSHETGTTPDGKYIKGEIKLDVTMDEEHPEADIHFHSSQGEQEHFHGVDLNFLPGPVKRPVFSRFSPLYYQAMRLGIYSYCDVTPGAVQTFDNFTYNADMSECPTLISGDCAVKPRYVVLGRKVAADKIGVTILMGEHKIEFVDTNTATVDGKSVPLSEKVVTNEGDTKIFKIFKHDDNNVFVYSQPLSVFVRYTGYYTTVTVGSRYRATQCGLCGNFDGCPENDLVGPDASCKGMGPNDMMKAYIVRDGNCAGVGSPCPVSS